MSKKACPNPPRPRARQPAARSSQSSSMSRKIPHTEPSGPGGHAADAAALAEAELLRNMNSLQWLGLQAELALERGLDLCAPSGDARRAARGVGARERVTVGVRAAFVMTRVRQAGRDCGARRGARERPPARQPRRGGVLTCWQRAGAACGATRASGAAHALRATAHVYTQPGHNCTLTLPRTRACRPAASWAPPPRRRCGRWPTRTSARSGGGSRRLCASTTRAPQRGRLRRRPWTPTAGGSPRRVPAAACARELTNVSVRARAHTHAFATFRH
jgi:hypothetical protein